MAGTPAPAAIIGEFNRRIEQPIAPRLVDGGPVKENINTGSAINVLKFPIPWWAPRDGGRHLGTWHGCVTRDPKTDTRNTGMYRMMTLDATRCAIGFLPHSHIGRHFAQQARRNEPMEMAVVIGPEEVLPIAVMTGLPLHYDEYGLAGALRGAPLDLVKCETVDLEIPATAEIVIEGRILPHERAPRGLSASMPVTTPAMCACGPSLRSPPSPTAMIRSTAASCAVSRRRNRMRIMAVTGRRWPPRRQKSLQLARLRRRQLAGETDPAAAVEIARLQDLLRGDFAQHGSQWRERHYNLAPDQQEAEKGRSYPGMHG